MVCKCRVCIYEKNYQCTLPETAIDENGFCFLSRYATDIRYADNEVIKQKAEEYIKQLKIYKNKDLQD